MLSKTEKRKIGLYVAMYRDYDFREVYKEIVDIEADNEEYLINEFMKKVRADESRFIRKKLQKPAC